jgi:hypothetical protein
MTHEQKSWDDLSEASRKRLWYLKSDRVPQGWSPSPRKKGPRKDTKKPWGSLSEASKKRLFLEGSPRVPKDWELTPRVRTEPYKPWDQLSLAWKNRLYNEESDRVPPNWAPPPARIIPGPLPFHELSESRQKKLYYANSDRVPPGWKPKLKGTPGVKMDWEDLAETTKLARLAGSHPSCPPELLAAFKAERARKHAEKLASTLLRRNTEEWNALSEEGRMRRFMKNIGYVPPDYKPNLKAEVGCLNLEIPDELHHLQGPEFTLALTRYLEVHPEVLTHG